MVYVDSGSTDGSVDFAREVGCAVVQLDLSTPFTAARARNAGYSQALRQYPDLAYIQFIDGDCELAKGWVVSGADFLDHHAAFAVVCGRRRERFPQRSIYNQLIDIEWNTPVGETKSCGGDALMRVAALLAVGGFRESLIAGEEPELCVRLRRADWKIMRLDQEMTLHDAAIIHFSQWWKRAKRAGYAFAAVAALHGAAPEYYWVKESRSAWLWGLLLPAFILSLCGLVSFGFGWLLLVYPAQVLRIALKQRRQVPGVWHYALSLVLGKFPEMLGQCKYWWDKRMQTPSRLIEYK